MILKGLENSVMKSFYYLSVKLYSFDYDRISEPTVVESDNRNKLRKMAEKYNIKIPQPYEKEKTNMFGSYFPRSVLHAHSHNQTQNHHHQHPQDQLQGQLQLQTKEAIQPKTIKRRSKVAPTKAELKIKERRELLKHQQRRSIFIDNKELTDERNTATSPSIKTIKLPELTVTVVNGSNKEQSNQGYKFRTKRPQRLSLADLFRFKMNKIRESEAKRMYFNPATLSFTPIVVRNKP